MLVGQPLGYLGNFLVGLGWIGVVMLLCRSGWTLRPFAAVGRTALSNYLLQTVLCTTIFYGHGLGLFARVERTGQIAIVAAVWTVQILVSSWWVKRFAVGPGRVGLAVRDLRPRRPAPPPPALDLSDALRYGR